MHPTRKNLVLLFLAVGHIFHFANKFLLNPSDEVADGTHEQAGWQLLISALSAPIELVLIAPIDWLQQDPDPPPPFRLILLSLYWSLLALTTHWIFLRKSMHL